MNSVGIFPLECCYSNKLDRDLLVGTMQRNEMNFDVQNESQYWFSRDVVLRMSESNGNLVNPHN